MWAPVLSPIQFFCISKTLLRPFFEKLVPVEKFLGVGGDLQEPVIHLFLLDARFAAPARAARRLLIGQDRPALGHQLTQLFLRKARPRSNIFRKIHWFHL